MHHGTRLFSRSSRRLPAADAFTLVELLVVIAVIAILAGLLFPVIGGMVKRGHQSASASNLRQWHTGYSAAVGDNDGLLPTSGYLNGEFVETDEQAWFNRLPRGMKERPLAEMQANSRPKLGERSIWMNPTVKPRDVSGGGGGGFVFCYGYNDKLVQVSGQGTSATQGPLRIAALQFPNMTILMGEKADALPHLNMQNVRAFWGSGDIRLDDDNLANFVFCDGHVEAVKRSVFARGGVADTADAITRKLTTVTWLPNIPE
jgi:prepilin-type N-terminal cleavage/methylation domain-containing protein/prepilin-type processing-associated H-X9-DG protein